MPSSAHNLGLARLVIPHEHLQTARAFDLSLEKTDDGRFKLSGLSPDALARLCPDDIAHDQGAFDKANLIQFLTFLDKPLLPSNAKSSAMQKRQRTHQLLKLLSTGSIQLSKRHITDTLGEDDEHVITQADIAEGTRWERSPDFEPPNPFVKISARRYSVDDERHIPGATAAPERGFVLALDQSEPDPLRPKAHDLREKLLQEIQKLCINIAEDAKDIALTGTQLKALTKKLSWHPFPALLKETAFEERLADHIRSIERRARTLETAYQPTLSLRTLAKASSALTPMISGQAAQSFWAHHHFCDRNDSPLEDLAEELQLLNAAAVHFETSGTDSPAIQAAILKEFSSLLTFSNDIAGLMASAARKHTPDQAETFTELSNTFTAIAEAIPDGAKPKLNRLERKVRDTFALATKQGPGSVRRLGQLFIDITVDFYGDVVSGLVKQPALLIPTALIIGGLMSQKQFTSTDSSDYQLCLEGKARVPEMDDDFNLTGNTIIIDDPGINPSQCALSSQHTDVGWYRSKTIPFLVMFGKYQHVVSNQIIAGPSNALLHGIEDTTEALYTQLGIPFDKDSEFSKTYNTVIPAVADTLFWLNNFQDATHAPLWIHGFMLGLMFGFWHEQSMKKIAKMGNPLFNMGLETGDNLLKLSGFKKSYSVAENLLALQQGTPLKTEFRNPINALSSSYTKAVQGITKLPQELQEKLQALAGKPTALAGLSVGVAFAGAAGLDMAGIDHQIIDTMSRTFSGTLSTLSPAAAFTAFQLVQDHIVVHMLATAGLTAGGAITGAIAKKGLSPAFHAALDIATSNIRDLQQRFAAEDSPTLEQQLEL